MSDLRIKNLDARVNLECVWDPKDPYLKVRNQFFEASAKDGGDAMLQEILEPAGLSLDSAKAALADEGGNVKALPIAVAVALTSALVGARCVDGGK